MLTCFRFLRAPPQPSSSVTVERLLLLMEPKACALEGLCSGMHKLLSGLSLLGCGMVHDSTDPLDVSQHQPPTVGPGETLLYNGHALHLSVVRKVA